MASFFLNLLVIKQLLFPTSRLPADGLMRTGHTSVMDPSAICRPVWLQVRQSKVGKEVPLEVLKAPGLRRAWIFSCAKGFFSYVSAERMCPHLTCLPSHACCFCLQGFRLFCLLSLQLAEKTSPIQTLDCVISRLFH